MFTGIIEAVGRVKLVEKGTVSGKIEIHSVDGAFDLLTVKPGDSLAVDGVCLTLAGQGRGSFIADISEETFSLTTLGLLTPGALVNLERALTLSTPIGGHLVTGHIDGLGTITSKPQSPYATAGFVDLEISLPPELLAQVVKKGSIAVDGISLTVAGLTSKGVRIAIIPTTLDKTSLGAKPCGSLVNIETDIIGKYVERFMIRQTGDNIVTEGFLKEHGFING